MLVIIAHGIWHELFMCVHTWWGVWQYRWVKC